MWFLYSHKTFYNFTGTGTVHSLCWRPGAGTVSFYRYCEDQTQHYGVWKCGDNVRRTSNFQRPGSLLERWGENLGRLLATTRLGVPRNSSGNVLMVSCVSCILWRHKSDVMQLFFHFNVSVFAEGWKQLLNSRCLNQDVETNTNSWRVFPRQWGVVYLFQMERKVSK